LLRIQQKNFRGLLFSAAPCRRIVLDDVLFRTCFCSAARNGSYGRALGVKTCKIRQHFWRYRSHIPTESENYLIGRNSSRVWRKKSVA